MNFLMLLRFVAGITPELSGVIGDLWFGCDGDIQAARRILKVTRVEMLPKIECLFIHRRSAVSVTGRRTLENIN